MPRRPRRVSRKPRRKAPRRKTGNLRQTTGQIHKFKVNLLPEYLTNHGPAAAGTITLVTDQPTPAPITSTTQTSPDAAASGLPGYYSFGQGLGFALIDLQRYSQNFTTNYDQYRINSITCKITYLASSYNQGVDPTVYAYVDYDDNAIPANQQAVVGRQGVKRFTFNDRSRTSMSITFKPKAMVLAANTTASQPPAMPVRGWLDCNQPGINHNGLKIWWENLPLLGQDNLFTGIQYEFVYNVSMKMPINTY